MDVKPGSIEDFAHAWQRRIVADLVGFADRGVAPRVDVDGPTISASWEARGRARTELFNLTPQQDLTWVSGPTGNDTYNTFLVSSEMADFPQLAQAVARDRPSRFDFVASQALVDRGLEPGERLSAEPSMLTSLAGQGRDLSVGYTSLLFVKGDPGAGKTTLLQEATGAQSRGYVSGHAEFLLFYVSAQGRELSNLRDAFSGELQDLRAGFTRDAIPALARAGLLVPVIDGFDELLGTAGYSGAFSSLQGLLDDMQGQGTIIISARSAFYDLEFLDRSSTAMSEADIAITTIGLEPWTDDELARYLKKAGTEAEHRVQLSMLSRLSEDDRVLLRRPFFASQYSGYARRLIQGSDVPLSDYLIDAYIEREADKIVDSHGDPVLPVDGHRRLFELVASEMWEQEIRNLPVDDLRALTEVVAEERGLAGDQATQLSTKVTSYAGFRTAAIGSRVEFSFEHEVYFDHFLSRAIRRLIDVNACDELRHFFDRGVIPEAAMLAAVRRLTREIDPSLLSASSGVRVENRRRNSGALIAAYARAVAPVDGVVLTNLSFIDVGLNGAVFVNSRFEQCSWFGTDLRGTRFEGCELIDSTLQNVRVNDATHFGASGLIAGHTVGTITHDVVGDIFEPLKIAELLGRLGCPDAMEPEVSAHAYSPRAEVLIKLLHLLARAFRRTTLVYETDDAHKRLVGSNYWPELRRLLLESGVLTEEARATSGPGTTVVLRLRVDVNRLLLGQTLDTMVSGPIEELWRRLRNL